jgi:hypothetical protein
MSDLMLAQKQIDYPASSKMRLLITAMSDDFCFVATSVFQLIGQQRHPVESTLVVNVVG